MYSYKDGQYELSNALYNLKFGKVYDIKWTPLGVYPQHKKLIFSKINPTMSKDELRSAVCGGSSDIKLQFFDVDGKEFMINISDVINIEECIDDGEFAYKGKVAEWNRDWFSEVPLNGEAFRIIIHDEPDNPDVANEYIALFQRIEDEYLFFAYTKGGYIAALQYPAEDCLNGKIQCMAINSETPDERVLITREKTMFHKEKLIEGEAYRILRHYGEGLHFVGIFLRFKGEVAIFMTKDGKEQGIAAHMIYDKKAEIIELK